MDDSPAHVGPFTVQLPTEVEEADKSVVGERGSVWVWLLERRGGEPVVVLDVIDLRKGRSEGGREGEELIIIGTIRKAKFHQGNTF